MDDVKYAKATLLMLEALGPMIRGGFKPTHAVMGLRNAMSAIGVDEHEIRQTFAAMLLLGPDGSGPHEAPALRDIQATASLMRGPRFNTPKPEGAPS